MKQSHDIGYLYLIQPYINRRIVKFGRTIDFNRRIKQHTYEWPDLKVLGCIYTDDLIGIEKSIKQSTRHDRVFGRELVNMDKTDTDTLLKAMKIALFSSGFSSWSVKTYNDHIFALKGMLSRV